MPNKNITAFEAILSLLHVDLKTKRWSSIQLWHLGEWLYQQHFSEDNLVAVVTFLKEKTQQKWTNARLHQLMEFNRVFPLTDVYNTLSWTHYQLLKQFSNLQVRDYYLNEAVRYAWSCQQLRRQIQTQQYERYLSSCELGIKSHYVIEFAKPATKQEESNETRLEQALVDSLQELLLEFGPGFSFVARQKLIKMPSGLSFYVDLVLYHTHEHRTVLVELKTTPLSHRDVGQIDTYVRLYDAHYRSQRDGKTIGLLLGPSIDQNLRLYSALADNAQLFAARFSYH